MKGERTNWEFHGFTSNPQKSYEAGKKGSVLATQASLQDATHAEKTASKVSNQNKPTQGKGWHSPRAGANDAGKKKASSEE